jgi:hypothetical protein
MLKKQEPTNRIRIKGGAIVDVNFNLKGNCKKCGREFFWAVTRHKTFMPVVQDENGEYMSHFADCPFSNAFRK